jgi:2-(1,2-epoxy-1,2-dihydrophenyl)acetyl-CoA isomerase
MSSGTVLLEIRDAIARVTLNRPDKLNSFNVQMHDELRATLDTVEAHESVRVLVIAGAGRGFCAGQDLGDRTVSAGEIDLGASIQNYYAPLVRRLRKLPLPVIAAVNGVAAGAGANLAFACDVVIAAESASFIQSFCKLGLVPDTGGTYFLPRLVGTARAMGMALFGDKISAEQAAGWGLIWKCVPDAEFPAAVDRVAIQLAAAPTLGLVSIKQAIYSSGERSLDEQLDFERDTMRELGRSADFREGVAAFLEKRAPKFVGR